jgi:hypothetical protein
MTEKTNEKKYETYAIGLSFSGNELGPLFVCCSIEIRYYSDYRANEFPMAKYQN